MKSIIRISIWLALLPCWSEALLGQSFTGIDLYIQSGASFTITGGADVTIQADIYNSGTFEVDDEFTYDYVFNNEGIVTIGSSANFENENEFKNTNSAELNINGTFENEAGAAFTNEAVISIGATGVFNNDGEVELLNSSTLTNNGILETGAGGSLENGGSLINNGQLVTEEATLTNSGTLTNNGEFINDEATLTNSGTLINHEAFENDGSLTITSGGTLTNHDEFNNYGGVQLETNGTFTNNASFNNFGYAGCAFIGTFENQSGATFTSDENSVVTISGGGSAPTGIFQNSGELELMGSSSFLNANILDNQPGGNININSAAILDNFGSFYNEDATLTNDGTLTNYGEFRNDEATLINNGTLTNYWQLYNDDATFTNASTGIIINDFYLYNDDGIFNQNGTYSGVGSFSGSEFVNPGTLAPGSSPGCNFFQNGFSNSGIYEVELSGTTACTGHDKIYVTGTATLGGSLTVSLINGYTGSGSDQVTILQATSVTGTFTGGVSLPTNWHINYLPTSVVLSFGSPLPVELVSFTARPLGEAVLLDWQTASELNNAGFHIERMTVDDGRWSEIGFVAGNSTTTETHNYSFLDEKPLPGTNYYRLRQTDFDGNFEYSHTVSVDMGFASKSFSLFPNPAPHGITSLYFPEAPEGDALLEVFNWLGSKVYRRAMTLEGSGEMVLPLDLKDFPSGTYVVILAIGDKLFSEKLMLNK